MPPPRRSRWFDGVAEVTAGVECSGEVHRVSWRRGKVVLHDHSLRDEEVMRVLGGAPPPCLALLDSWRDSRGWERASRPQPPGFVRRLPPPPLPDALVPVRRLGVAKRWHRKWRKRNDPEVTEDLYRLLRATALPVLRAELEAARAVHGGGRSAFVEVRMSPDDEEVAVDGRIDPARSTLVATLPPAWLFERSVVIRWRSLGDGVFKAEIDSPQAS